MALVCSKGLQWITRAGLDPAAIQHPRDVPDLRFLEIDRFKDQATLPDVPGSQRKQDKVIPFGSFKIAEQDKLYTVIHANI